MEEYEGEENVFDLGADFAEVASQPMYDPTTSNEELQSNVNLTDELAADFSKLESVLASVPLWVRLGEHSRFALGVSENDKIENYVDPLPSESAQHENVEAPQTNDSDTDFLRELAGLSLDEDGTSDDNPPQMEMKTSSDQHDKSQEDDTSASTAQTKHLPLSSSPSEERDDFDKWLDEV